MLLLILGECRHDGLHVKICIGTRSKREVFLLRLQTVLSDEKFFLNMLKHVKTGKESEACSNSCLKYFWTRISALS